MPIHEYRCQNCNHHFEALVRKDSEPTCMRCGARELERKVSLFAARIDQRAIKGGISRHCATCMGGDCGSCLGR